MLSPFQRWSFTKPRRTPLMYFIHSSVSSDSNSQQVSRYSVLRWNYHVPHQVFQFVFRNKASYLCSNITVSFCTPEKFFQLNMASFFQECISFFPEQEFLDSKPSNQEKREKNCWLCFIKNNAHTYTHKLLIHKIIRNKLCCLLHSPETLHILDTSFLKMNRHLDIFHMQIPCIFWIDAWELICPLICPTVAKFNKATIQAHFSFQEISAADALSFLSCLFYWLPLPQLTRSHISLGMMLKPCFCVFLFLIG